MWDWRLLSIVMVADDDDVDEIRWWPGEIWRRLLLYCESWPLPISAIRNPIMLLSHLNNRWSDDQEFSIFGELGSAILYIHGTGIYLLQIMPILIFLAIDKQSSSHFFPSCWTETPCPTFSVASWVVADPLERCALKRAPPNISSPLTTQYIFSFIRASCTAILPYGCRTDCYSPVADCRFKAILIL